MREKTFQLKKFSGVTDVTNSYTGRCDCLLAPSLASGRIPGHYSFADVGTSTYKSPMNAYELGLRPFYQRCIVIYASYSHVTKNASDGCCKCGSVSV